MIFAQGIVTKCVILHSPTRLHLIKKDIFTPCFLHWKLTCHSMQLKNAGTCIWISSQKLTLKYDEYIWWKTLFITKFDSHFFKRFPSLLVLILFVHIGYIRMLFIYSFIYLFIYLLYVCVIHSRILACVATVICRLNPTLNKSYLIISIFFFYLFTFHILHHQGYLHSLF